MRPATLATFLLSLALLPAAPAAAQGPAPGANAALDYWQAFAFLPALDQAQEKVLEGWDKVPLDATARELVGRYRMSRPYLLRGAKAPRCDWGLDYGEGVRLLLPHLPKAITLARLAALDARNEFAQGHWAAGSEDVAALLGLARHLEADRIMIANLVGRRPGSKAMAIEAAAPYLPDLKSALPAVSATDGATLPEMVLMEKRIGPAWLIGEMKAAEGRRQGSWRAAWDEVFGVPNEGGPNAGREAAKAVKTLDQAVKALEGVLPWYDRLAELAALPRQEFDRRLPRAGRASPRPPARWAASSCRRWTGWSMPTGGAGRGGPSSWPRSPSSGAGRRPSRTGRTPSATARSSIAASARGSS